MIRSNEEEFGGSLRWEEINPSDFIFLLTDTQIHPYKLGEKKKGEESSETEEEEEKF